VMRCACIYMYVCCLCCGVCSRLISLYYMGVWCVVFGVGLMWHDVVILFCVTHVVMMCMYIYIYICMFVVCVVVFVCLRLCLFGCLSGCWIVQWCAMLYYSVLYVCVSCLCDVIIYSCGICIYGGRRFRLVILSLWCPRRRVIGLFGLGSCGFVLCQRVRLF